MPRDYKHAARESRAESRVSSGLLGLVAGFAAGFGAAVLLQVGVPEKPAQSARAIQQDAPVRDNPKVDKPKFDFYQMLPNFEVVIPEQDKEVRRSADVSSVEKPGTYVLQAGSFRGAGDADKLRARLALAGIESSVQTVTIDRDQTWHRVRIGPFNKLEQLNEARRRLAEQDIQALVIRLGE